MLRCSVTYGDVQAAMEPLAKLPVAHNLCYLNTNCIPVHVENNTSAPMIEAIGHALLDRCIHHYVHIVATLEDRQIARDAGHALGLVLLRELVAGAMTITPRFRASISHSDSKEFQGTKRVIGPSLEP